MARLKVGDVFVYQETKEAINKLKKMSPITIDCWLDKHYHGKLFVVTDDNYEGYLSCPVRSYCIRQKQDSTDLVYWVPHFIVEKSYYTKRIATYE